MNCYQTEDIDVGLLKVSSHNVRKDVNEINGNQETSIEDLATSILEKGLLNPITVRSCSDGTYEVFAGQRRLAAVKSLGFGTIRCTIVPEATSDSDMKTMSLVENFQRQDNSYKDKVEAFSSLLTNHCNGNIKKLCKIVGGSEDSVRRYLKMQQLPGEALACLDANDEGKRLPVTVAVQLVALSKEQQGIAAQLLVGKTVEEASEAIKHLKRNPAFNNAEAIENAVTNALLTRHENILVENRRLQEESWRSRHPWIHDPENLAAVFEIENIHEAFRLLHSHGLLSYVQGGNANVIATKKRRLDADDVKREPAEVKKEYIVIE